jgi:elongation factor 1-alpha
MNTEKPLINIIVVGHVDHGKSTFVGRLLLELGEVRQRTIDKYKEEAKRKGKATFELAWVMDSLKEERERGITISLNHKKFATEKYNFTIIDAPGHKDFVKNMITGAAQTDAALLVVSRREGIMEQTKEHLFIIKTFGIKSLIIRVNKFDETKYDQKRFNEVVRDLHQLLMSFGINPRTVSIIPISAYHNDNILVKSQNTPWYTGPTILQALNAIELPARQEDKPLRVPIEDVYTIQGIGLVPVGRVESGVLKKGAKVVIMPKEIHTEIRSIEMHHQSFPEAKPGMNVGLSLKGIGKDDIKKGDIICPPENLAKRVRKFTGQIMIMPGSPTFHVGYSPIIHAHTAQVACKIIKIIARIDPKTGAVAENNPETLKAGDVGIVEFEPLYPLIIEPMSVLENMARFAIRDMGKTLAAGRCIKVEPALTPISK